MHLNLQVPLGGQAKEGLCVDYVDSVWSPDFVLPKMECVGNVVSNHMEDGSTLCNIFMCLIAQERIMD